MAIYHFNVKILGASEGRSAVQFSAYMSGEKDFSEVRNETFDCTSKEEVAYSEMIFSDDVPYDLRDRSTFWNEVEKHETQKNAQYSRAFELAFDKDADPDQMIEQANKFANSLIEDGYSAVQVAVHLKEGNPHAHIMCPCRQFTEGKWNDKPKQIKAYVCRHKETGEEKLFEKADGIPEEYEKVYVTNPDGSLKLDNRNRKTPLRRTIQRNDLDSRDLLIKQRERWAQIMNMYISDPEQKVSHLSYEAQGIRKRATKHLGYHAAKLEREGIRTEIGDYNRAVKIENRLQLSVEELEQKLKQEENLLARFKRILNEVIQEHLHKRTPVKLQKKEDKPEFMIKAEQFQRQKEAYRKEVALHENDPDIDDRIPELREKYNLPPKREKKRNLGLDISL